MLPSDDIEECRLPGVGWASDCPLLLDPPMSFGHIVNFGVEEP